MPLKLNIGFSRKTGEANFGSRGATVGLDMEVEASLIHQPQRLQDRITHLFHLAKDAVDRELTAPTVPGGNGAIQNGAATGQEPAVRPATRRQVSAICAIANDRQIDLATELQSRFGVVRLEELSIVQASELIDSLKQRSPDGSILPSEQAPAENGSEQS